MNLSPGLYVAATPIGNLRDVTYRVIDVLKAADAILCEDTRHTAKLCAAYGVATPRRAYHEHNAAAVRPALIRDMLDGRAYCLVSDAGTPLIADPGYKLVAEARDAGVDVFPLPGPNAAIAAMSVAGLPTDRFVFAGFPPAKTAARRAFLKDLAGVGATLVFYEAPGRVAETLRDMAAAFGPRRAVIARELTKLHEEVRAGTLDDLAESAGPLKGEVVLLVGPPTAQTTPVDSDEIDAFLTRALEEMSLRDAAAAASEAFSIPKKASYEAALALKAARKDQT